MEPKAKRKVSPIQAIKEYFGLDVAGASEVLRSMKPSERAELGQQAAEALGLELQA